MLYKHIIRPLLFRIPPERIHALTMRLLRIALRLPITSRILHCSYNIRSKALSREFWGLHFPNPIGLPAGFDKGAHLASNICNLGFGFTEIGTVTPKPQPGNPKPRIFRLPDDQALINRMGFNSEGAERIAQRLAKHRRHRIPVGGNIGKNTATDNAAAAQDYATCMRALYPLVDYFVVNVSCPNVSNLRDLASEGALLEIVDAVVAERDRQKLFRPILLKLSPDQQAPTLKMVVQAALQHGIDGFVITNTTTSRLDLKTPQQRIRQIGNGGLSGAPLREKSLQCVQWTRQAAGPGVPIIGVGGITSGPDALAMLQAGASLVQIYTGLIYQGPAAAKKINRYLLKHLHDIPSW